MPFARRSASPAGAMTPGKAAAGNADARDRHSASDARRQGPAGSQATRWYGGRRQGDQADSRFIPDHLHPLHRRPLIHRSPYTVDEEIVFRLVLQQQLPHSLPESRCVGVPR